MINKRLTYLAASVAAVLLFSTFGCAPKQPAGPVPNGPRAAWELFRQNYCVPPDAPAVSIKASLHYTRVKPRKLTNYTRVSMWGDFGGPMRLDIQAGIGKLIAHIREDSDGLLVFYPTDNVAYAHVNPVLGATRLGMPFPFSLDKLAHVSMSDFSVLVSDNYSEAIADGENFVYTLESGVASSITLDKLGRPIIIEGITTRSYGSGRAWQLDVDKYDEDVVPPRPDRVTLTMDNGEKGALRIKTRELKVSQWPEKATELTLPDDVLFRRLDNGFKSIQQ